jgi:hypothetical protein
MVDWSAPSSIRFITVPMIEASLPVVPSTSSNLVRLAEPERIRGLPPMPTTLTPEGMVMVDEIE